MTILEPATFDRDTPPVGNTREKAYLEGFWGDSADATNDAYHGCYPFPAPQPETLWCDRDRWLARLRRLEQSLAPSAYTYGAPSTCRLCGCTNGAREFLMRPTPNSSSSDAVLPIAWPDGFAHYVQSHSVLPSRLFFAAVLTATDLLPATPPSSPSPSSHCCLL